jgi:YVTN family beta-propeller protein
VIDTTTNPNTVATVQVGSLPIGVAVSPDGKRVYVTNTGLGVSVIDTTTNPNTVVATIGVGNAPLAVAGTPDGKHAYVANANSNNVSVIETTGNTVVAGPPTTIPLTVGNGPMAVAIGPVPFRDFNARLQLDFIAKPTKDFFALESSFTLSMNAPAIHPLTQAVSFQVGPFSATIPAGSFKQYGSVFAFAGVINGVNVQAQIAPTGTLRYAFAAAAEHPNLTGTTNPVPVSLTIGSDTGTKSVNALIFH